MDSRTPSDNDTLSQDAYRAEYNRILDNLREAVKNESLEEWKATSKRLKKEFTTLHRRRPVTDDSKNPKNPAQHPFNGPLLFVRYLKPKAGSETLVEILEVLDTLSGMEIAFLVLQEKTLAEVLANRKSPPDTVPAAPDSGAQTSPMDVDTPSAAITTAGPVESRAQGKSLAVEAPSVSPPERPLPRQHGTLYVSNAPQKSSAVAKRPTTPAKRPFVNLTSAELYVKYGVLPEKPITSSKKPSQ
ncbi:hypothetical protein CVT26_012076 [Gymnopilus dilepis]|uniref:Uncharacterized protein n=1 Tax=Gymnopilus dilepis TaxID=231916 RepID=A0A409X254_9AGAR|nr:hypothetical protein CVT26_012076 [Gymnopilus dilepis]